ncbi:MAG: hypothetical protein ACKV2T_10525 [Kofleriaceae bacterium]
MSGIPAEIAGIGSTNQKLRVSPGFDPLKAGVGPEEYFLLSRIDGNTQLRSVLLDSGLSVERAVAIVTRLRSIGALLLPGEASPPPARPMTPPPPPPSQTATQKPPALRTAAGTGPGPASGGIPFTHDLTLPATTPDELRALAEDIDLDETERRRILAMARLIEKNDPYLLLGVSGAADPKTLKRAYFLLSKEVHPDRYYGKRLGTFADRLTMVFEATSRAYNRIISGNKRASSQSAFDNDQPQTPQEYAAELFDRACQLEVRGDALGAMKLFAAAVRVDPQTRYLRRATSCALQAGQPRTAVEYAKKAQLQAPNDVSSARLLASAFRAAGKLSDAEDVLLMAMALKSENDVLTSELRNDLAEVRRQIAANA